MVTLIVLSSIVLAISAEPAAAQFSPPPCGFGFWKQGDTCRMPDGRICEVVGYPVSGSYQTKCTKLKRHATRTAGGRPETAPTPTPRHISARANLPTSADRAVATGVKTKVAHYYSLNPSCKPNGPITIRIVSQPQHGTMEIAPGMVFPTYAVDNVRVKCNIQEIDAMEVWYKSADGYKGRDEAAIEILFPGGYYSDLKLVIEVK